MLFVTKSKVKRNTKVSISGNNQTINSSSKGKYPGLNIDCSLSGEKKNMSRAFFQRRMENNITYTVTQLLIGRNKETIMSCPFAVPL
jgi:hypothetical protein